MTPRPPLDYSLAAQGPAESLRNALTILQTAAWGGGMPTVTDVTAVRRLIAAALAQLERPT